jgi:hypothetical protein
LKDWKIEALNKKIYLNCMTFGKFISGFRRCNVDEVTIIKSIVEARRIRKIYSYDEFRKKEMVELNGAVVYEKEGKPLSKTFHYSFVQDKNLLFGTSHVPSHVKTKSELKDFTGFKQWRQAPLNGLILHGAKDPGTIVCKDVHKVDYDGKTKIIPKYQLLTALYFNSELFDIDPRDARYCYERRTTLMNALTSHLGNEVHKLPDDFIDELDSGNYDHVLLQKKESEIVEDAIKMLSGVL